MLPQPAKAILGRRLRSVKISLLISHARFTSELDPHILPLPVARQRRLAREGFREDVRKEILDEQVLSKGALDLLEVKLFQVLEVLNGEPG